MSEKEIPFKLPRARGGNRIVELREFAKSLIKFQNTVGFRISSRGWCYQLEGFQLVSKDQFDRVEKLINECRANGLLPIDFVAEEYARQFTGIEVKTGMTPAEWLQAYLRAALSCEENYTPEWWTEIKNPKGEVVIPAETYYIQMIVEKIDLKTMFEPVTEAYHIPIATTRGWSSMLQRAEYAKRFMLAEEKGLKCVLLYCGDHDPDGLRISDFLRSNLNDLSYIRWNDGTPGYDPKNLTIDRFGLNADFIETFELTWIDGLITASGKDLADPSHPNNSMEYVQDYLAKFGARKCEANALIVVPDAARELCKDAIEEYLGSDALDRFAKRKERVVKIIKACREKTDLDNTVEPAIDDVGELDEAEEE
jgi:hypothetical protein